jgi:hypothetical protein
VFHFDRQRALYTLIDGHKAPSGARHDNAAGLAGRKAVVYLKQLKCIVHPFIEHIRQTTKIRNL